MQRLMRVLAAATVALAVTTVVTGPAVAAKGGNGDNAHACQQGGGVGLLDENEVAFRNAGDCASHGAKGRAYTGLSIDMGSYSCYTNETCNGTLNGSNLQANSVSVVFYFTDGSTIQRFPPNGDSLSYQLLIQCDESSGAVNVSSVQANGTTAGGTNITTPQVGTPCA
jgi:hypothetical protein